MIVGPILHEFYRKSRVDIFLDSGTLYRQGSEGCTSGNGRDPTGPGGIRKEGEVTVRQGFFSRVFKVNMTPSVLTILPYREEIL